MDKRRKVAIFTYSLVGGGAERMVSNLLNSLDRSKYHIHLILMNTEIDYIIPEDQLIHYLEKSNSFEKDFFKLIKLPFLAYKLARYCKQQKIEMVFAVMNRPNMIATMAKYFRLKSTVLISEQFYTPYFYNNLSFAAKFKSWLLRKTYKRADAILPNSIGTKDALQHLFKISVPYHVIKNPTNVETIKKLSLEEVDENTIFKKFTFINVSSFRSEKNHDLLIEATAELKDKDFQLILIGKGIRLEVMKKKVFDLGLNNKIIFINYTENPFKYLAKSQCFLLSSLTEGFPNILIESMVCGLPIISSDCKTGPRELIAPGSDLESEILEGEFEIGEFGLLCRNNSKNSVKAAMLWALDNPSSLDNYKRLITGKASAYEIDLVANEISELFDFYLK